MPGQAIGAIDIYDNFTFVDVPAQYREQVLDGMRDVVIRNRAANMCIATPRDKASASPNGKSSASINHSIEAKSTRNGLNAENMSF